MKPQSIVAKLNKNKKEAILLINKVDLVSKDSLLALSAKINQAGNFKETFFISALNGQHTADFYQYLADICRSAHGIIPKIRFPTCR